MIRTYSELIQIIDYKDRFDYLNLHGKVGEDTFGFDRKLNQRFYHSKEWKQLRNKIIMRDCGCDMAHKDNEINGQVIIHHMNPIIQQNIIDCDDYLINPEYLVCVSLMTHNAIHYGDYELINREIIERRPGDTRLW